MIKYNVIPRDGEVSRVELNVDTQGLDIILRAGTFRLDGVDYAVEEHTHTCELDPANPTSVRGYLVLDGSTVRLLVDEVVHGKKKASYVFMDGAYRPLFGLFFAQKIPPGTADLSSIEIVVERTKTERVEKSDSN